MEAYRGYYNERWPHNLSPQAVSLKEYFLNVYGAADGYDGGDPAGSGDYAVGLNARRTGWVQSTAPRHPSGTNWLLADRRGRLAAFAVVNQQAAVWLEAQPGADQWRGPFFLGGGPLAPNLAVSLTPDGRWQIFALRLSRLAPDGANAREIVLLEQSEPDGVFPGWITLGNPSAGDPQRDRHLGAPAVTRDGRGRLHLFVRNAGQGLHSRVQETDGSWGEWTDLRGHEFRRDSPRSPRRTAMWRCSPPVARASSTGRRATSTRRPAGHPASGSPSRPVPPRPSSSPAARS
ncbi:hypothetical protein [Streptomyces sp. NPDC002573]|uniref:hypothetical protein n=1 Tax=Streptomyces sp. NPDC002573 TaxID=3364651 RepID=UPI0036817680